MTFPVSLIWALGALLASGVAAFVLKRGGYGLITDIGLGLGGSLIGSLIFRALGISLDAGLFPMAVVAFIGAAGVIVVQRMINDRLDTGPASRSWESIPGGYAGPNGTSQDRADTAARVASIRLVPM